MQYLNNVKLLDFFTVNGDIDGAEYKHPEYRRAAWSVYSSAWSVGLLAWRSGVHKSTGWLWLRPSDEALQGKLDVRLARSIVYLQSSLMDTVF